MWLLLYGAGLAACGLFSIPAVFTARASASWGSARRRCGCRRARLHIVLALGFGGIHLALGTTIVRHHGG